jgi:hypothetical protein
MKRLAHLEVIHHALALLRWRFSSQEFALPSRSGKLLVHLLGYLSKASKQNQSRLLFQDFDCKFHRGSNLGMRTGHPKSLHSSQYGFIVILPCSSLSMNVRL